MYGVEERAEVVDCFVNQLSFIFAVVQPNALIMIIIDYHVEALSYPYYKRFKYNSQKQYKFIIDDFSDYKKFYINVCVFTEKIVCNQDKVEKTGIGRKKEKKFDDPFVLDSDNIKSVSALPVKKMLVGNCIHKTNGFCIIYVCLSIRFKMLFHYLCLPSYRYNIKYYKYFESKYFCMDIAKENILLYKIYLLLLAKGRFTVDLICII